MKRVIFAFVLAVFAGGAAWADYVKCTSCAKYDVFGGDATCSLDLQSQCGSSFSSTCVFDEDSGTVYCNGAPGGGSTTCTCPSGYSGTCTGTNYSTCYRSCNASCSSYDIASCNSIVSSGGGFYDCSDPGWYVSSVAGRQYYGGTCTATASCKFNALGCGNMKCPSGYQTADGGSSFNSCKEGTGVESNCYKSCSGTKCSGNDTGACPSNATCTYNTSFSYGGKQYYGGSCDAGAAGKCPVSSFSCASGYYKSGSSCARCPWHGNVQSGVYGTSNSGATSITSCFIGTATSWSFSDSKGIGREKFSSTCYYSN